LEKVMPRLARFLSQYVPHVPFRRFYPFERLRETRGLTPCTFSIGVGMGGRRVQPPLQPMQSVQAVQPIQSLRAAASALVDTGAAALAQSVRARRHPVRVYQGASRLILVGNIDAVCGMIDRYIADQDAGLLVPFAR
jgi:hypothetical protein